jgi:threonine aldolase
MSNMTNMTESELRDQCDAFFHGNRRKSPATTFTEMAAWAQQHHISHDVYGEGELIKNFEQKVARLLGFEAGLFCITGTMTQPNALHVACLERGSDLVGLHASSHIMIHENSNYQLMNRFKSINLGEPYRPWLAKDLQAVPDRLAAVLYELPMREIGGQMPSLAELDEIKRLCGERNIHLHMDGARLWEAATGYGKPLDEVCAGFDSCYVSLYKGIGGLGGAMLLGKSDFITKADVWMKRSGGNLIHRSPYIVAAAMQFEQKLAAMPRWLARTHELVRMLAQVQDNDPAPLLQINPATPQCNLLHLYFPLGVAQINAIRNCIAEQERVWLFGNARNTALPNQSMVELYIGENLCDLDDQRLQSLLQKLLDAIRQEKQPQPINMAAPTVASV